MLTILQMLKVAGSYIFVNYLLEAVLIVDAAFDFALILFAIGLIRLGRSLKEDIKWKLPSGVLISSSIIDIIAIILAYVNVKAGWSLYPFIYVRLILITVYFSVLALGFLLLRTSINSLYNNGYLPRKGQWYIPLGIVILLAPAIINWYSLLIYPVVLYAWIQNVSLILFLFAAFLLILGFFGLSSTMNMFKAGKYSLEDISYDPDDANYIGDVEPNQKLEGEEN
jgi:hypothetical protein